MGNIKYDTIPRSTSDREGLWLSHEIEDSFLWSHDTTVTFWIISCSNSGTDKKVCATWLTETEKDIKDLGLSNLQGGRLCDRAWRKYVVFRKNFWRKVTAGHRKEGSCTRLYNTRKISNSWQAWTACDPSRAYSLWEEEVCLFFLTFKLKH